MSQQITGTIADLAMAKGEAEGLAKGMAKGMAKGKAEGKAEGRLQACQENLIALLEERFGPLPEALVQRITSTSDLNSLQKAIRQVVNVQTLEEFRL